MCRHFRVCVSPCVCVCVYLRVSAWTHENICQRFSCLISYRLRFQSWHFSSPSARRVSNWPTQLGEQYMLLDRIFCCKACFPFWTFFWTILLALNVQSRCPSPPQSPSVTPFLHFSPSLFSFPSSFFTLLSSAFSSSMTLIGNENNLLMALNKNK